MNVWRELFEAVEQIQAVQAKIRALAPSAYLDCAWADALDCENNLRLALNETTDPTGDK